MTKKVDCVCEWDDDNNVISFCGAHMQLHNELVKELRDAVNTGIKCMKQRDTAYAEVARLEKLVNDISYTAKKRKEKMHGYRDTLRSIGKWSQATQDEVEAAGLITAIMMWRGCVAEANRALEKENDK